MKFYQGLLWAGAFAVCAGTSTVIIGLENAKGISKRTSIREYDEICRTVSSIESDTEDKKSLVIRETKDRLSQERDRLYSSNSEEIDRRSEARGISLYGLTIVLAGATSLLVGLNRRRDYSDFEGLAQESQ